MSFVTSALYVHSEDQAHEVPPVGVFGRGKRQRPTPHIIEPEQIRAIMQAALDLPPTGKISPYTYHYLFGVLAATGLRISEALALQRDEFVADDVDTATPGGGGEYPLQDGFGWTNGVTRALLELPPAAGDPQSPC